MRRREVLLGLTTLPWGGSASWGQGGLRVPTVGFVGFASPGADVRTIASFRDGLRALGHAEGRTIRLEIRSGGGDVERGHALIEELAAQPVDVFLSPGPAATRSILRKTRIPIVAVALPATQSEPELFKSLARPGGSVTGFSAFGEELSAKRIEILKEALPGLKVIGVLHNSTDPTFRDWGEQTIADARAQGIEPVRLGLATATAPAVREHFRRLRQANGTAVIVIRDFLTSSLVDEICRTATEAGIAVIGEQSEFAEAGALFTYGADIRDLFRRAAAYVDRILRGEKAAELPIQLPTKFELVVNLRTARALGVDLPATTFARADQAIE